MGTVILVFAVVHGLAAVGFLILARKSSVLVDDEGRPLAERAPSEVHELTTRIAPLAPENTH